MGAKTQQQQSLKITGLYSNPNLISQVPPGSMKTVDNCVIRRPSIIENRRGEQIYGTVFSNNPDGLFNFRTSLLSHAGTSMYYDSNGAGTWTAYSGSYSPPSSFAKIRSQQANNNFYFQTANGVYKNDSVTGTPVLAGAPRGLGGTGATTGTSGFQQPNTNVAYRLVWGYTDANNNLILGAPSDRVVVGCSVATFTGNITSGSAVVTSIGSTVGLVAGMIITDLAGEIPTGTTILSVDSSTQITLTANVAGSITGDTLQAGFPANVSVTFNIPAGVTDGVGGTPKYFYQLYRSSQSINLATAPNDELQQVYQLSVAPADLIAKTITIIDQTPDDLREALIYTAPSQGGIQNSNFQPPLCNDLCLYYDQMVVANTTQLQALNLNMIGAGSPSFGYASITGTTTNLSTTVSALSATAGLRAGQRVIGTGIPTNTTIISINTGASTMVISAAATGSHSAEALECQDGINVFDSSNTLQNTFWGASTTDNTKSQFQVVSNLDPATNIQNTSINLINLICEISTFIVAYYESSFGDVPGQMLFNTLSLNSLGFYFTATYGAAFNPALPTTGNSVASLNNQQSNYIYYSPPLEPESFPLFQFVPIGDPSKKILRIFALRYSLVILKEDGVFRIQGPNIQSSALGILDTSVQIICPESAVILNNAIYCYSNQGIVEITESEVDIKSFPIENTLLEISSEQFTNFPTVSFGVSYETERTYIFYTVTNTFDTVPTQAFVYNWYTNAWTRWPLSRTCGLVNSDDNKLYTGNPVNDFIYQERKDFTNTDYADEQFAVTVVSSSGSNITLSSTSNCEVDQTILQDGNEAVITKVVSGTIITVDENLVWTAGAATVFNPIISTLEFNPLYGDNPGINKEWQDIILFFQNAGFTQLTGIASNNFSSGPVEFPILASTTTTGWGNFGWGTVPWGGSLGGQSVIRIMTPTEASNGLWINFGLINSQCFNAFGFGGCSMLYRFSSDRFR